jgi:hypothetical protein
VGKNTITTTQQQLLIHLDHPTRERILDIKATLHHWNPEDGATICITMPLSSIYFSLALRAILLKDFAVEKFVEKHLLFELTIYKATQESLQQFFKPTETQKKFPVNLSFFCDATTLSDSAMWIHSICGAFDNQIFSEHTKFYMGFPISPTDKAKLDSREIVYVENQTIPKDNAMVAGEQTHVGDSITQILVTHAKQAFFKNTQDKDNRNVPHKTTSDAIHALHPLELNICFDARSYQDESAILQAFEDWTPTRRAQLILSVRGLDARWGTLLRMLFVSETCQALQARNVAFTLKFQQASDEGLEAFFTDHEKKLPQKLTFICDNTTHTESWYGAIIGAIRRQRFSEFTSFDMSFHKFSPSKIYNLKILLNNSTIPKNLSITYHVGRSSLRTLTSVDHTQHVFTQTLLGHLPVIEEQEEEESDDRKNVL